MDNITSYFRVLHYSLRDPKYLVNYLFSGELTVPEVAINHENKTVYVFNPKIASTSISYYMANVEESILKKLMNEEKKKFQWSFQRSKALILKRKILNISHLKSHEELKKFKKNGYFIFSFVRNPYDRLKSFFLNKFVADSNGGFKTKGFSLHLGLNRVQDFSDLVYKISHIPDTIADAHFKSQTSLLYGKKPIKLEYDLLGRLERFDHDFSVIRERFNHQNIKTLNKSSLSESSINLYKNNDLKNIVYQRYKTDFNLFGYQK